MVSRNLRLWVSTHSPLNIELCRDDVELSVPVPEVEHPDAPLDYRDRYELLTGKSLRDCPICGQGHMVCIETFLPGALPRGPPDDSR